MRLYVKSYTHTQSRKQTSKHRTVAGGLMDCHPEDVALRTLLWSASFARRLPIHLYVVKKKHNNVPDDEALMACFESAFHHSTEQEAARCRGATCWVSSSVELMSAPCSRFLRLRKKKKSDICSFYGRLWKLTICRENYGVAQSKIYYQLYV